MAEPVRMPCSTRKRGYGTKAIARTCAARAAKKARRQLAVYRCPECREWHMSSILDGGPTSAVAVGRRKATPRKAGAS